MEFNTPSTLTDVYKTLKDIFYYYRIRRGEIEEVEFTPLELPRLSESPYKDGNTWNTAKELLSGEMNGEKLKRKEQLEEKISVISSQIKNATSNYEKLKANVNENYNKSREDLIAIARKSGINQTTIYTQNLANIEVARNQSLLDLDNQKTLQLSAWNSEMEALKEQLANNGKYIDDIYEYRHLSRHVELKEEYRKTLREIQKYNNSLFEKEERFKANIEQIKANIKLKKMQALEQPLSKDQLIEMGYYDDVIRCVTGYFDVIASSQAYTMFKRETGLILYLEEYYQNLLYKYYLASLN